MIVSGNEVSPTSPKTEAEALQLRDHGFKFHLCASIGTLSQYVYALIYGEKLDLISFCILI